MSMAVTTQEGADVETVKNVIINPDQKDVILEISKDPQRGDEGTINRGGDTSLLVWGRRLLVVQLRARCQ